MKPTPVSGSTDGPPPLRPFGGTGLRSSQSSPATRPQGQEGQAGRRNFLGLVWFTLVLILGFVSLAVVGVVVFTIIGIVTGAQ